MPMPDETGVLALAPCPFCEWDLIAVVPDGRGYHFGFCSRCEAEGPIARTYSDAVAAWNRRVPSPASGAPSKPTKCAGCGVPLHEGTAKVFTVCDACWDKAYPKRDQPSVAAPTEPTKPFTQRDVECLRDYLHLTTDGTPGRAHLERIIANVEALSRGEPVRPDAGETARLREALKGALSKLNEARVEAAGLQPPMYRPLCEFADAVEAAVAAVALAAISDAGAGTTTQPITDVDLWWLKALAGNWAIDLNELGPWAKSLHDRLAAVLSSPLPEDTRRDAERWRWFRQFLGRDGDLDHPDGGTNWEFVTVDDSALHRATARKGWGQTVEYLTDSAMSSAPSGTTTP